MDAEARSNLYGFFSRLFIRELDEPMVELLEGPLGAELLPGLHGSAEQALLHDPGQRVATFDADFVHLTVVNVVPYASFYLREDGMVESGTTNPLVDFMKSYGFEIDLSPARSLAPDHVGIELEAMSTLCRAEAEAHEDPKYAAQIRDVQRRLLRDFMLPWLPVFFFAVERCAHTKLYREAASVCMDFVASDHEGLSRETDV
jgi:TorA maturation chaperone TorD